MGITAQDLIVHTSHHLCGVLPGQCDAVQDCDKMLVICGLFDTDAAVITTSGSFTILNTQAEVFSGFHRLRLCLMRWGCVMHVA